MLDSDQQRIQNIFGERALVLAGPGCGKTYILARRVFEVNAQHGVGFEDMLCMTFTNRAAREMNERISSLMGYVPEELFVGNMHRFCFRFLLTNNLLAPETGILDEDDQNEYLLAEFGINRAGDAANFRKAAVRVFQDEHDFPEELKQRLRFTLSETDYSRVKAYMDYKRDNMLVDYDELILRAYEALSSREGDTLEMSSYSWIQVDEVQDMTPLQLAIVRLLANNTGGRTTCLYLGDEQQAIFSFTGAGGPALERLKQECHGHIYHLKRNYRSPRNLVELCNELARVWLDIDEDFLPSTGDDAPEVGVLRLTHAGSPALEAAHEVMRMTTMHPHESVSVLVHTNQQAELVSQALDMAGVTHIKLSRNDMFHQPAFKTIYSHLAVVMNAFRVSEWARLLYQTGAAKSLRAGRRLCSGLIDMGISPAELLGDGDGTILERFCELTDPKADRTIAVLDTETTGLDIFEDDVVEISAVKMRGGRVPEGSEFDVLIRTDRPLPRTLGKGEANPLLDVYDASKAVSPEEGLRMFAEYLCDVDAVAGHNLDFDLPILRFNYRRRSSDGDIPRALQEDAASVDTLWVSRLTLPRRRSYRLGALAGLFGIDTGTAHLAIDDARATAKLVEMLRPMALTKLPRLREAMADPRMRRVRTRLEDAYGHHYRRARALLEDPQESPGNCLVAEMTWLYDEFESRGLIERIEHYDYLARLVDEVIVDSSREPRFREQLTRRLPELLSFNEGDLFTNGIIMENVSVMTIHKAKGLEMDNVIIYSADTGFGSVSERAKVFYVAFSRARKRLTVHYSCNPDPIVAAIKNKFRNTQ
ncbi:MAG: UvrD-helicase domain-containing protein [Muribaculaceae bacterium]|nr:UvrD-helicase domain-containing protein [Muribaculaceae bacterium]